MLEHDNECLSGGEEVAEYPEGTGTYFLHTAEEGEANATWEGGRSNMGTKFKGESPNKCMCYRNCLF